MVSEKITILNEEQISAALLERSKLQVEIAQRNHYRATLRKQIEAKIPQEILDELAALDSEFPVDGMQDRIAELEEQVRLSVVALGRTVKVEGAASAIYSPGKVTWNTDGLEGLMVAVPQLEKFRKVGKPFTTIR